MADLNFPKDRTELVPPGTGALQTGDTYTANGTTWVYDATTGAWDGSSSGGGNSGDLFLSKVSDDTAAGEITFEGLTTHENGISVTGGTPATDPTDSSYPAIWGREAVNSEGNPFGIGLNLQGQAFDSDFAPTKLELNSVNTQFTRNHPSNWSSKSTSVLDITGDWTGDYTPTTGGSNSFTKNTYLRVRGSLVGATTSSDAPVIGISSGSAFDANSHWRCFEAADKVAANPACQTLIGYHSNIRSTSAADAWAFYGAGTASSWFGGSVFITKNNDTASETGISIYRNKSGGGDASSTNNVKCIKFYSGGTLRGYIGFDGSGGVKYSTSASDYRLKENVVDLPSAVEKVKALRPVNFNFIDCPGKTRPGFIAHELQEIEPLCVSGEKDGVTQLGTITYANGDTKENEEQPDAVPFGATWEATHTVPDYQSASSEPLIPLLTKALQEALEKIETLETRLSDAGIA